jgi:hypothetical protein
VKPATVPLHMTFDEADAIPDPFELRQPMLFEAPGIRAIIDPRNLEYGMLRRADVFVLRMIRDSWPERPIYFARSASGYPHALGLGENVLTQGLATKLFVPKPTTTAQSDTLFVQGDGWLDVPRTHALWSEVFHGHQSVVDEGQWVDRPSAGLPVMYLFLGVELTEGLRVTGKAKAADSVAALTRQVAKATAQESLFRNLTNAFAPESAGDSTRGIPLRLDTKSQPKVQSTDPAARKPRP